jgi:hypothetical protein
MSSQAYFKNELIKLIQFEINDLTEKLVSGNSLADFAAYRHQIGIIKGLQLALELIVEAQTATDRVV